MTLQEEIHKYQIVLQAKYPNSLNTHRTYLSSLKKYFSEFKGNIKRATSNEIAEYIGALSSESMMRQMHGALKNYYTFVLKPPNKITFVPFAKMPDRLPDIPCHKDILTIIDKTDNVKHKLMLSLLYGCGLRVSELTGLKWIDIIRTDADNPLVLKVHGKGKKDRFVPVSENNYELLIAYCKEYQLKCETDKQHYILGGIKPYSVRSVEEVCYQAGRRVGLRFKLTPHKLRHALGEYLYNEAGYDLPTIAHLFGHKSVKTTQIYARLKPQRITTPV